MKYKIIRALVAIALFIATPLSVASAADMPLKAPPPPPPPAYSWTGFYIGGDVGGAWTSNTATWTPLPSPAAFGSNLISGSNRDTDVIGGFYAGYNWQFAPTWVAGIEGDWSWTHANGSLNQPWTAFGTATPIPTSSVAMSSTLDWLASARGRFGYLVSPSLLAYVTGGAAWGDISYSASSIRTSNGYSAVSAFSSTSAGWVVGGGLEWAMTKNWLIRAEYLYYHLNSAQNVTAQSAVFPAFPSGFSWNDTNVSTARAGLSYKF